jgi:uncharacterized protein with gpF-like domain
MAFKSLFPHEEELRLNKTLDLYQEDIQKLIKKFDKKEKKDLKSLQLQIAEVTETNKKAFIQELAAIALEINKTTFEGLTTLSAEDMINSDLKGAKKWIKANVELFDKLDDTLIDRLQVERLKRIEEATINFNKLTSSKIGKLESGELSKTDLNKIKDTLSTYKKPNKEIKALIDNIDNYDKFTKEDLNNLSQWMNNRNDNWARNETGNFYAEQTKDILIANDMEFYLWISERDNLVREEHRGYDNGQPRSIDEGIMPGEDFNCRCHAEPVKQK